MDEPPSFYWDFFYICLCVAIAVLVLRCIRPGATPPRRDERASVTSVTTEPGYQPYQPSSPGTPSIVLPVTLQYKPEDFGGAKTPPSQPSRREHELM